MTLSRLFISQESLDHWLTQEDVLIEQDELSIPTLGARFRIVTALHFVDEVTGADDDSGLLGTVKDLNQLEMMGGEHCADSVILGDNAYQVVEGFAAELLALQPPATPGSPHDPHLRALSARLHGVQQ